MKNEKAEMLYEGKAKKMYAVAGRDDVIWVEFKDSLTAFNAQKKSSFAGKGAVNAQITTLLYKKLEASGVATHLVDAINDHEMICRKVRVIPLEVVTRNRLAGSTAKKFGLQEGTPLPGPLVEFYYKDDALNDPFVSDDQAIFMQAVSSKSDLDELRTGALKVNQVLQTVFTSAGMELIDFKLEFGRDPSGKLLLADEISPDTCRLWDMKTGEKLDKDRFRRDLDRIEESYHEVLKRLKGVLK